MAKKLSVVGFPPGASMRCRLLLDLGISATRPSKPTVALMRSRRIALPSASRRQIGVDRFREERFAEARTASRATRDGLLEVLRESHIQSSLTSRRGGALSWPSDSGEAQGPAEQARRRQEEDGSAGQAHGDQPPAED